MKKIYLMALVILCSLASNAQVSKYATFEADITNTNDPIYISIKDKVIKKLVKNGNGIYKDTLNAPQGSYTLFDGKNTLTISLNNECDLKLKMDANNVDQTIVFSGTGSEINNYLAQTKIAYKKTGFTVLFDSDENTFTIKAEEMKRLDLQRLDKYVLNPAVNANIRKGIASQYEMLPIVYKRLQVNREEQAKLKKVSHDVELDKMNNTISPSFNYRNYKGGKSKLDDFKGKFVFIDIWATWCGPCVRQIPFLQKLEEKYKDKNIVFVSISIDKQNDIDKWKKMVKEKDLGGVQLLADNDWDSDFIKAFGVKSIPRFILIGPDGVVIKADAERPSNPELVRELDKYLPTLEKQL
jgi:thiol-disulfide isomerase/thioredoxin